MTLEKPSNPWGMVPFEGHVLLALFFKKLSFGHWAKAVISF
jgi:hypothetical protein